MTPARPMDESAAREHIVQVEAQIEELFTSMENCRKVIVLSKTAIAGGGILMLAMTFGAIDFNPVTMIGAISAVVGGTVLFGSNRSTLAETKAALDVAEAQRAELLDKIDLRTVGGDGNSASLFRPT